MAVERKVFQAEQETSSLVGFQNILRNELSRWWSTRFWWVQILLWIGVLNGMLALIGAVSKATGEFELGVSDVRQSFGMLGALASLGVVISMQNRIIGDREKGITEWVLSKPVSRSGYLLGKLFGNAAGLYTVIWLLPAGGVYILLSKVFLAEWLRPGSFLLGWGIVGLDMAFYLCLTLMLGVFTSNRAVVLAVPLALLFGQQIIIGLLPMLVHILPYSLSAVNAGAAALSEPVIFPGSIIAAAVWCVAFIVLAVWRFRREDF
jgi:ABC-type transport system involved in multi-copper enzyme maturation permease subunit